jgi:hypothetical protein
VAWRGARGYCLRFKLLLLTAILVIVPATLFGIIAYGSGRESLQRVIGRHLAQEAGNTAGRLAARLTAGRDTVRSCARQDLMREIRVGDIDKRISAFLTTVKPGDPACLSAGRSSCRAIASRIDSCASRPNGRRRSRT